jgi:DNA-binding transcriptional regulator LsrR (DeoR family)
MDGQLLTPPIMRSLERQRLLTKVSQMYYLEDMTQATIATRLRLSRQKVQRLIRDARAEGVVRISIRPAVGIFADLERVLQEKYGLREAVVVDTSDYQDQAAVARDVGAGAAEYLLRVLPPTGSIVISWGGTMLGMVNALAAQESPDPGKITVIQGLGGLVDPNNEAHAADLTRRLARFLGGTAQLLPAPGAAGSPAAARAFYKDPHVSHVIEQARRADIAVMGIGAPRQDSILVRQGTIVRWPELTALIKQGAVGDINLRYFDAAGRPMASDLDDRVIGLTLAEIKRIKHVVGVAGGASKLAAIRGALEGRLIHSLVTDSVTARALAPG